MDTVLQNRTAVLAYMSRMAAGDTEAALALTSEDVQFVGPDGKSLTKGEMRDLLAWVAPKFAGPMQQTVLGTTAEGNRVAVEATGRVTLRNGKTYANRYHLLFEVTGGQISAVREYCDTTALQIFAD